MSGGISYASETEGSLLDAQTVFGMSFTRNKRDIAINQAGETISLQQNIVFAGGGVDVQSKEFPIIEMEGSSINIRGKASLDMGMFYTINRVSTSDKTQTSPELYTAAEVGGEIVYYNQNGTQVSVGAEVDVAFTNAYNREMGPNGEKGSFGALGQLTPNITGGRVYARLETNLSDRTQIVVDPYYVTTRTGESTAGVSAGLVDSEARRGVYGSYRISRDPLGGDLTVKSYRLEANQTFEAEVGRRRTEAQVGGYVARDTTPAYTNTHGGLTLTVRR